MRAIIDENTDQMHAIGNKRMDTLKFLLVENNWKRIELETNEVLQYTLLPALNHPGVSS